MNGYGGHALAPLPRRVLAWTVDAALGAGLALGFAALVGATHDVSAIWHLLTFKSVNGAAGHQLSTAVSSAQASALRPVLGLLGILAVIAVAGVTYRVVTVARWGAGVGKAFFGLQVVVDQPTPAPVVPGWGRAWKRWVVPQAPGLIPLPATGLLAFLPASKDARRRGVHDRAAGTVVIDVHAPTASPLVADWAAVEPVGFFG